MSQSLDDQFTTRAPPWLSPWPATELCPVEACPVCGSADRTLLHKDLIDNIFYCAPGKWTSWSCSSCGSAYLDPRPSPASIHLAYETYYTHEGAGPGKADYADLSPLRKLRRRLVNGYANWRFSTGETPASSLGILVILLAWAYRRALASEYRHLPRLPAGGGALLDIGCGGGSFLRIAQSCGWQVTGLDPDPKVVASSRAQGWNMLQGGVEQFDGKEGLFDVITMSHVIEHVHEPVAVMKTCHRLLKPGGRLWLQTPNIDSLGHRHYGHNWRGLEPPRHLVLFNRRSLRLGLSSAGFDRIEDRTTCSPLTGMTKASEAIKRGQLIDDEVPLDSAQKWRLRTHKFVAAINPARREFLTLVAFKN